MLGQTVNYLRRPLGWDIPPDSWAPRTHVGFMPRTP